MSKRTRNKGHGEKCHWCGRQLIAGCGVRETHSRFATKDHVIPRSQFGGNNAENIVWCCRACNQLKGNKMPEDWQLYMKDHPSWWKRYRL